MTAGGASSHVEVRAYCSAVDEALTAAGIPPGERWDEAHGTALYWTKGDRVLDHGHWVDGLLVFWGTGGGRQGWGCAPLDADGDPELRSVTWLPLAPSVTPDELAGEPLRLFTEGVETPGASRRD